MQDQYKLLVLQLHRLARVPQALWMQRALRVCCAGAIELLVPCWIDEQASDRVLMPARSANPDSVHLAVAALDAFELLWPFRVAVADFACGVSDNRHARIVKTT